jgi:hypothetical protein
MDTQAIVMLFGGPTIATFVLFWLHNRLAGTVGRPGPASMFAFVLGWLCVMTAVITGMFLLLVLLRSGGSR